MKLTNKEFIKNIEKKYTFEKNPSVAVAVSGGPDSMSLLFLVNAFIKYKKGKLIALIVDHRIRKNSKEEAKYISEKNDKSESAIASQLAAKIYNLEVLKSNIEDESGNVTRFFVMGKDSKYPESKNKKYISFYNVVMLVL